MPLHVFSAQLSTCRHLLARRTQFTLHGLWPNLDNPCLQDYPEHCPPADPFDFDLISDDTRDKMKTDWPSYKNCTRLLQGPHLCMLHVSCI